MYERDVKPIARQLLDRVATIVELKCGFVRCSRTKTYTAVPPPPPTAPPPAAERSAFAWGQVFQRGAHVMAAPDGGPRVCLDREGESRVFYPATVTDTMQKTNDKGQLYYAYNVGGCMVCGCVQSLNQ